MDLPRVMLWSICIGMLVLPAGCGGGEDPESTPTARSTPRPRSTNGFAELRFNGTPAGDTPFDARPGEEVEFVVGGFGPGSTLVVAFDNEYKNQIQNITFPATGPATGKVTLPEGGAGVHKLIFDGVVSNGVGITQVIYVRYPGRPVGGGSYRTYLCCFELPADSEKRDEAVLLYEGIEMYSPYVDRDGGVLVELPVIIPRSEGETFSIQVRNNRTGETLTEEIKPLPSPKP